MADVILANTSANLSGDTLLSAENADTITGLKTFDRDPAAPFAVSSGSAKVDNLDADTVDGLHAADLGGASVSGNETITGTWTFTTNPVFNAGAIPETAIADGSVFPRLAGNETITGTWTFNTPPVIKSGTGSATGKQGALLYSTNTSTGNVGSGEDTLFSQAIAASVLGTNGDVIVIEAIGNATVNANAKVLRFKWDGSNVYVSDAQTNTGPWTARITISRRGATSQAIGGMHSGWTGQVDGFFATGSATLSGAVTFAITAEAVSNNDVTIEMVNIWWYPVA